MFDNLISYLPSLGLVSSLITLGIVVTIFLAIMYRRVVSTNMVHIVQRRHKTMPYGTGQTAGNVYYKWPTWVPFFGITVIELQVSNFDLSLKDYEAYDKDRVPFEVDVTAFFRIADTARAAQRVANIAELREQLNQIVQGAVRKVLASDTIDTIMVERSKFGDMFTNEVAEQLMQWGVESVKSMELMDIRDGRNSKSISAIMAKKISHIAMESRIQVAQNNQAAEVAEIAAGQNVLVKRQEADQIVGQRTAERDREVGIAKQQSEQAVLGETKTTATAEMDVLQVRQVRQAEIEKAQRVVTAEQEKQIAILAAEGSMEAQKREAEGTKVLGEAKGAAEQAMLMAPVNAQITLAEKIAALAEYQKYLIAIEAIKAHIAVGSKQAEALKAADIKVIANTGKPIEGVGNVMDLLSSKGGTDIAAMVEGFAQSPLGEAVLGRLGVNKEKLNGAAHLSEAAHPSETGTTVTTQ